MSAGRSLLHGTSLRSNSEDAGRGRMKERLSGPKAPRRAADIWAATYVLLGLRYSDEFAHALFEEVLGMEESATYQAIVRRGREEGRAEGARHTLFLQGKQKF